MLVPVINGCFSMVALFTNKFSSNFDPMHCGGVFRTIQKMKFISSYRRAIFILSIFLC